MAASFGQPFQANPLIIGPAVDLRITPKVAFELNVLSPLICVAQALRSLPAAGRALGGGIEFTEH